MRWLSSLVCYCRFQAYRLREDKFIGLQTRWFARIDTMQFRKRKLVCDAFKAATLQDVNQEDWTPHCWDTIRIHHSGHPYEGFSLQRIGCTHHDDTRNCLEWYTSSEIVLHSLLQLWYMGHRFRFSSARKSQQILQNFGQSNRSRSSYNQNQTCNRDGCEFLSFIWWWIPWFGSSEFDIPDLQYMEA